MSRIPQTRSPSKPSARPPTTPLRNKSSSSALAPPSIRVRTTSTPRATAATPARVKSTYEDAPPVPSSTPALSIKEVIALRRAEAKKAQAKSPISGGGLDSLESLQDAIPDALKPTEEEDILGRLSIRDTIERARSTGSVNIAGRSLPCLPSALFEIHLNITPEKLRSVPNEPVPPPSEASTNTANRKKTTWFEAQDLTVLKAWNNEIVEVQQEISLFGSLKNVDLHKNKIAVLPHTFADLTNLTNLDLSHNALTELPENIFALPELVTLNLSHNQLVSLPFNAPFKNNSRTNKQQASGGLFGPTVTRSTTPLPRLAHLDASNNNILANKISCTLPVSLTKVDLSYNPLGQSQELLCAFASLKKLKELKMERAEIGDDSFPSTLLSSTSLVPFPSLKILDASETQVQLETIKAALSPSLKKLDFNFIATDLEPPEGTIRVLVGKRVVKEAWEIELERKAKERVKETIQFTDDWTDRLPPARRVEETLDPLPESVKEEKPKDKPASSKERPKEIVKEAWEIELEMGLGTTGARRRLQAQAQAAAKHETPAKSKSPSTSLGLANPQYYNASTLTLQLPASLPPQKTNAGHGRAFSVASSISFSRNDDLAVPAPTLPLSTILSQPIADNLRALILSNRRLDRSFALPCPEVDIAQAGYLPYLEELNLEGCSIGDLVSVSVDAQSSRTTEPILPLIAKLFPTLQTLNLSSNGLTDASLTHDALSSLLLASPSTESTSTRKGLRQLRLQGNRITSLSSFLPLCALFKGHRQSDQVPEWKLEELDVRDNAIEKLDGELGVLPLDVFLVDGNLFRVPQRRVWEREGTKGLLNWLRGRIE